MAKPLFTYDEDIYTPQGLKNLTTKEIRKEYSRLRSTAMKRLKRFEGTEFTDSQMYKKNINRFNPLKTIKSEQELRMRLVEVQSFLTKETSTVTGQKKVLQHLVEAYQDKGLNFINKSNARRFEEFVSIIRSRYGAQLKYIPDEIADVWHDVGEDFMRDFEADRVAPDKIEEAFRAWLKKTDTAPYKRGFEQPRIKFEREY